MHKALSYDFMSEYFAPLFRSTYNNMANFSKFSVQANYCPFDSNPTEVRIFILSIFESKSEASLFHCRCSSVHRLSAFHRRLWT